MDFNQEDFTQRIKSLIENSCLTNRKFAIAAGIDPSGFDKKLKGIIQWTVNDIDKLSRNLNLRKEWLIDGEGEQFNGENETNSETTVEQSRVNDKNFIPLIPTNAMAGSLTGNDVQIMPYDIETFFVLPTFAKSDFCIRVEGRSMEPTYFKGDIIACKYVPMSGIFFQWGKVYVLATDQGVLVKHIDKGSDNEHVKLISDNPEFKPFEVPVSGIYSVAIINGLIRVE